MNNLCWKGASRQRRKWSEIKSETSSSFQKVATPDSNDYELLSGSILEFIELVMELELQDQFPSDETARILLDDEEEMNYFPTKNSCSWWRSQASSK